jgi:hypothetical protein
MALTNPAVPRATKGYIDVPHHGLWVVRTADRKQVEGLRDPLFQ